MPNTYTQLLFHVHLLTAIPTTLSLADYVKEVKTGTSRWLKEQAEFRRFEGWQDCSMNIGDCSAKTAFRSTNDTWPEPRCATTWHTSGT